MKFSLPFILTHHFFSKYSHRKGTGKGTDKRKGTGESMGMVKGVIRIGNIKKKGIDIGISIKIGIGGFHITQLSLIITQVKNKIVYHLIY